MNKNYAENETKHFFLDDGPYLLTKKKKRGSWSKKGPINSIKIMSYLLLEALIIRIIIC
jgi:hypothetical protein